MTGNNYYTITISHNPCTAALTLCRLPCKIRTDPIPLSIGFLIFRNFYLARIITKAHRPGNTARERLWGVGTSGRATIATIQTISY
jgi:hypothetical protein